ncbi:hypothetical protein PCE1_000272 [Barthelona sp. PCE]
MPAKKKKGKKSKKKSQKKIVVKPRFGNLSIGQKMTQMRILYANNCTELGEEPCKAILSVFRGLFNSKKKDEEPTLLERLQVVNTELSVVQIHSLLTTLVDYPYLKSLIFVNCNLTDDCCIPLSHYLNSNLGIETLILDGNQITADGITHVCRGLVNNTSLKNLSVSHNPLGDRGCLLLTNMLKDNLSIEEISLRHCQIDVTGGVTLFRTLLPQPLTRIKHIDMSGNPITDISLVAIGETIQLNKSVEAIILSNISLTNQDTSIEIFLNGLTQNSTLKQLDLSHNLMTEEQGIFFTEHMKNIKNIVKLRMPHVIGKTALKKLITILEKNIKAAKPSKKKKGKGKGTKKKKKPKK